MESSRRDLLNDMAEHRSILKNNQVPYFPVLVSLPKQAWDSLKQMFLFHCVRLSNENYNTKDIAAGKTNSVPLTAPLTSTDRTAPMQASVTV